jgi:hypothetical protein
MPRHKKPDLQADAAYENAHLVARDLLERIRELLSDMPAPGNDEHPIDWADVEDINEVNHRLWLVISYLKQTDA